MNVEIFTAPLIGGCIGLITNSLAIKMLFRPYKEIRIARFRVPFTPGLIPKEKSRIAHAIANVIANNILDKNTILSALASDSIREIFEKKYDEKLNEWKNFDFTCGELIEKYNLEDSANIIEANLRSSVSKYFIEQLQEKKVARNLIIEAFQQLESNMNSFLYKMGKKALEAVRETMIDKAEDLIAVHGEEFIGQYIDEAYLKWLDRPVCEIVILAEEKFPDMKKNIWEKYMDILKNKSGQFFSAFNIEKVIEDKINEYNLEDLEKMIMEISKKELNALVWLGGVLGVIMGYVNLLF